MNRPITLEVLVAALGAFTAAGCQHSCYRPACPAVAPGAPWGSGQPLPAGGAVPFPAPGPQPILQPPVAPGSTSPAIRGYEPPLAAPAQPSWRPPAEGGARLAPPEPPLAEQPRAGARLQPPETIPPPAPAKPPVSEERPPTPSLPVGIAQFGLAKDRVASGLRPDLDGVKWLQENRFRTVLHIRPPAEDDAPDRKLFEMRGLKYVSLEMSPQTLSQKVVDGFNRLVDDPANYPLFVYDKEGYLAGALWYLYFRTVDHASDADARAKAGRLGLKEDQTGERREMWLAIQRYLSERGGNSTGSEKNK